MIGGVLKSYKMKHKIHIRSSVFFWYSDNNVLFYDTESASFLFMPLSDEIQKICMILSNPSSLYSFVYDTENINVSQFVKELISKGFCVEDDGKESLISLPPILCVNNNWEIIKKKGQYKLVTELLKSIVFLMGGSELETSIERLEHLANIEYDLKGNALMDLSVLDAFLTDNCLTQLNRLSFVIGAKCSSGYIDKLMKLVTKHDLENKVQAYVLINSSEEGVEQLINNIPIPVHPVFVSISDGPSITLAGSIFLVQSKEEVNKAMEFISANQLEDCILYPQYNGQNHSFYECEVFPNIDELFENRISKRQIFIHRTLNVNYFGQLIVLPNAQVYSSLLSPAIGRLSDGIYSLVHSEMENNCLWRKTRNMLSRCKDCLYCDLCPSPILEEELMNRECPYMIN